MTEYFSRREWFRLAGAGLAGLSFSAPVLASTRSRNVLLLIADDLGLDMPSYGNPVIQMPNLERLASEGVRFTNAYCTTPSCTASRSVILTGLHNHRNGLYGLMHDYHHFTAFSWVRSLPWILKEQGYATGVVGKLHVGPPEVFPFDFAPPVSTRNVTALAAQAKRFFEMNPGNPFFLLVGFGDPHRSEKGFGNEDNQSGIEPVIYSPEEVMVPSFLPGWPETRRELAEYYQSASRMDQGVGLILQALREAGREQDTLVIFLSDNGIAFPGAKTCLYDPGIRLPLLVRSPEQTQKGLVNHAMVSFTDLMPTLLEWTGASLPPKYEIHGRSFFPILEQENPEGWDEIYFSHTFHEVTMYYPARGIRTRKYKYINNLAHELPFPFASDLYRSATWQGVLERAKGPNWKYGKRRLRDFLHRPAEELYDLENDPDEVKNLASNRKYREVLEELRQKTLSFRKKTRDPWLILNNYRDPVD
ncbi:MAG TPA: sulfatase [bacterium]|nr:sulfatase [Candidatus Omnitrophota bacterium]HOJ60395.1 sulfatase [bacterium]HOL94981.1 sulfatase [bacterium]HPP02533.1 sulfatase [bacterium]HXK93076.1 sulfatase [bacterium]